MTISIQHRLKPFCHLPGYESLIPGSTCLYKIFPTRVEIRNLCDHRQLVTLELPFNEFYSEFTSEVDYDRQALRVFGQSKDGFVEYRIFKKGFELFFKLERFHSSCMISINGEKKSVSLKEETFLLKESFEAIQSPARLFLGSTKKQELDVIEKSKDPAQILPYVFALGESFNELDSQASADVLDDIYRLDQLDELSKKHLLVKILSCHFSMGLIPNLGDDKHMGLGLKNHKGCSLSLIKALRDWMKSCLCKYEDDTLTLLNRLPKLFIAGKSTSLKCEFGLVHLEWTKGFVRRVILDVKKPATVHLRFGHKVRAFRFNQKPAQLDQVFNLTVGIHHLDRFEA